jgi:putative spermidine/putrescine transport system substrate-binding protein
VSRHGIGLVTAMVLALTACGAPGAQNTGEEAPAITPVKPESPITLTLLDGAGNVTVSRAIYDGFAAAHPELVSSIEYQTAPAPDVAGKVRAQQLAGTVDIAVVIGGTDVLGSAQAENLMLPLLPDHAASLPDLAQIQDASGVDLQEMAQGIGIVNRYAPAGPLLAHRPEQIADPPSTPDELLAWAREHPGQFTYAQPPNSGPGRTFLMTLPYMLGDSDPLDPVNGWAKTWAYLQELGQYVDYYPKGTTDTMKNLASGTSWIIASTTGWDINPRVLGTVPAGMKTGTLDGFHWVTDAHYAVIPKGVTDDVLAANLALIKWMLQPKQQAKAYDKGYFYPGPAVKDVILDMAPQESKDALAKFGRPEYDQLIESNPKETSLPAQQQVQAFQKWDREVGSGKTR